MPALYYCAKCKKKTEMKDTQQVTMKNGKPALRGQCAECGGSVNAIQGTKETKKGVEDERFTRRGT